ncbi:hypothetical protein HDU85_003026 [Gaertneriomyces sp. JEL0708]|nr:hypothetical protein HDU85_003026 [Gaertneriomyces sp. JEL0708]
MVGFFAWRKKKDEEDWEKLLAGLDEQIRQAETRLAGLKIRDRKLRVGWVLYSVPLYGIFLATYYNYLYPTEDPWDTRWFKNGLVILGTPAIYMIYKMIRSWYQSREKYELDHLDALRTQQKEKVEELKKKTAYYRTKVLLDRYDSPTKDRSQIPQSPNSPTGPRPGVPGMPLSGDSIRGASPNALVGPGPKTPQKIPSLSPDGPQRSASPEFSPSKGSGPSVPATAPPAKGWLDKLVDVVIGDSENPANKYALICEECFTHNGLVPPEAYTTARFRCLKCDHMNAPKNYEHREFDGRNIAQELSAAGAELVPTKEAFYRNHRASVPDELLFTSHPDYARIRRSSSLAREESQVAPEVAENAPTDPTARSNVETPSGEDLPESTDSKTDA